MIGYACVNAVNSARACGVVPGVILIPMMSLLFFFVAVVAFDDFAGIVFPDLPVEALPLVALGGVSGFFKGDALGAE